MKIHWVVSLTALVASGVCAQSEERTPASAGEPSRVTVTGMVSVQRQRTRDGSQGAITGVTLTYHVFQWGERKQQRVIVQDTDRTHKLLLDDKSLELAKLDGKKVEAIGTLDKPSDPKAGGEVLILESFKEVPEAKGLSADEAVRQQKEAAKALGLPVERAVDLGDGVELELVLIPA